MPDLNDLKLDKWQGSFEPEPARRGWIAPVAVLLLVVLGGGGYYFYRRQKPQPAAEVRTATEQAVAPTAPARPLPEAGEIIDLPPLPETDPIVRELVAKLSSHPTVAAWLTTDQLIRNFTVVVETIAAGRAFIRSDEPPLKPNRELLATGLANAGGALLGAGLSGGAWAGFCVADPWHRQDQHRCCDANTEHHR